MTQNNMSNDELKYSVVFLFKDVEAKGTKEFFYPVIFVNGGSGSPVRWQQLEGGL